MVCPGVGSDIGRCSPWTTLALTALLVSMPTLAEDVSRRGRDPRCPARAVRDGDLAGTSSATPLPGPTWRHHCGGGGEKAGTCLVSKYMPARACGKKTQNWIARYLHDFHVHAGWPPRWAPTPAVPRTVPVGTDFFSEQHPPTHASSPRGSGGPLVDEGSSESHSSAVSVFLDRPSVIDSQDLST
jgi:hypothetical protein